MKSAALTFLKNINSNLLNMITEFNYKGHHFKVTGIENNPDEFIIIRDGRKTKRVNKEIADKAMEFVEKLFD